MIPQLPDALSAELKPGRTILGKYRVIRVLGQGAMGVVVAARHADAGHIVAIKLMLQQAWGFGNAIERFLREARSASKLTGDNVARVLDVGMANGTPYIIMEYHDGLTLAELLRRHGPVAVEDAVDFSLQVCAAIAEAHELGVIHRDIKPGNLFLARGSGGHAVIKVLDFGLSKLVEGVNEMSTQLTDTNGTMGSPSYMSPEHCRSAKYADERSDIWSIGVTLFQLLSGELPFQAESKPELFANILTEEPAPITAYAPWVPLRLEGIIHRCLSKQPEQRFQRVTDLATALSAFASEGGRRFSTSPSIPVPWSLAPQAPHHTESARVVVEGPERLDIQEFFGDLPTNDYDIRALPSADTLSSSHLEFATSIGYSGKRRRGWIAAVTLLAVGMAVSIWILSRDEGDSGNRLESASPSPAAHSGVERAPDFQLDAGVPGASGSEVSETHSDARRSSTSPASKTAPRTGKTGKTASRTDKTGKTAPRATTQGTAGKGKQGGDKQGKTGKHPSDLFRTME